LKHSISYIRNKKLEELGIWMEVGLSS
jgi:hypothetical protein